jgi:hypothetical protein
MRGGTNRRSLEWSSGFYVGIQFARRTISFNPQEPAACLYPIVAKLSATNDPGTVEASLLARDTAAYRLDKIVGTPALQSGTGPPIPATASWSESVYTFGPYAVGLATHEQLAFICHPRLAWSYDNFTRTQLTTGQPL